MRRKNFQNKIKKVYKIEYYIPTAGRPIAARVPTVLRIFLAVFRPIFSGAITYISFNARFPSPVKKKYFILK